MALLGMQIFACSVRREDFCTLGDDGECYEGCSVLNDGFAILQMMRCVSGAAMRICVCVCVTSCARLMRVFVHGCACMASCLLCTPTHCLARVCSACLHTSRCISECIRPFAGACACVSVVKTSVEL